MKTWPVLQILKLVLKKIENLEKKQKFGLQDRKKEKHTRKEIKSRVKDFWNILVRK